MCSKMKREETVEAVFDKLVVTMTNIWSCANMSLHAVCKACERLCSTFTHTARAEVKGYHSDLKKMLRNGLVSQFSQPSTSAGVTVITNIVATTSSRENRKAGLRKTRRPDQLSVGHNKRHYGA